MDGWDDNDLPAWRADLESLRSVVAVFGSARYFLQAVCPFLQSDAWESRAQASELLIEAARLPDCPTYVSTEEAEEDPLQDCSLSTLWRSLVQSSIVNLGHRKSALRKLSIHVLRGFGARGLYADTVLAALQEWGLKDEDWRVRLHATLAVPLFADGERAPRGRGLAPVLAELAALLSDAELVAQAARQVVLDLQQVLGAALSEALGFVDAEARASLEEVLRSAEDAAMEELVLDEAAMGEVCRSLEEEEPVVEARPPLVLELSDEPSGLQTEPVELVSEPTPLPSPTSAPRILSTQVLENLEGLDWEQRCRGLQVLHETLVDTDFAKVELAERGEVMRVLNRLLGDAHFRIVLQTLTTVGEMCAQWTHHVLPVFPDVVPGLVDRLVDHKAVIRQSCHRCFGKVFEAIGDIAQPKEFFQEFLTDALLPHLTRDSWQMRRELFAVLVMAVLILRTAALTDPLLKAFCSAQKDCAPQVQACALEGLATANALGLDVLEICEEILSADEMAKVSARLLSVEDGVLPRLVDGLVTFPVVMETARTSSVADPRHSRQAVDSPAGRGSYGGKAVWARWMDLSLGGEGSGP
jgi:hypothetical protein